MNGTATATATGNSNGNHVNGNANGGTANGGTANGHGNNGKRPILISGAGIASLLLAQSLLRSGIPFEIYERDASLSFRGQGYRLRLSDEGLAAIESVLGPEAFARFYNDRCGKTGGSGFVALDAITGERIERANRDVTATSATATVRATMASEDLKSRGDKIVGIARGDMRSFFLEGIDQHRHLHFNKHVTGYELVDDDDDDDEERGEGQGEGERGGVRLVFADGTRSVVGSMAVGGEGIKSTIARQVSGGRIKVYDTGARGIHGQAPTGAFAGLGEGVFRMADTRSSRPDRVSVITNVRPGDMHNPDIEFGWTMGGPPGAIRVPNDDTDTVVGAAAATLAKALTRDWHPRFRPLFDRMNTAEAAFWKITCSRPSGVPDWPNQPRVTVIGDAAHAMTPAGGIGANTAVQDSALLGRLLGEAGGYRNGVTAAYEREMRRYAGEAVAKSYGLATQFMSVTIDEDSTPTVEPS